MHSSKALDSIKVKEDGVSIVTCSNDEQKWNVPSLIEVTAEGMNICVINLHPSNAYCPIEVTEGEL